VRAPGGNGMTTSSSERNISIAPRETLSFEDAVRDFGGDAKSSGYFVLTPLSGEFVAASRTAWKRSGVAGTIGTSVPAMPASLSARAGSAKRFVGVDDSGQTSVNSSRRGTFRSSLRLVETAGFEVTVRVTLDYVYAYEKLAAATSRSRDITVRPQELLVIDELSAWVIGADRSLLGDLRNIGVTVEVIGGNGAVMPLIVSTENSSEDMILRMPN